MSDEKRACLDSLKLYLQQQDYPRLQMTLMNRSFERLIPFPREEVWGGSGVHSMRFPGWRGGLWMKAMPCSRESHIGQAIASTEKIFRAACPKG